MQNNQCGLYEIHRSIFHPSLGIVATVQGKGAAAATTNEPVKNDAAGKVSGCRILQTTHSLPLLGVLFLDDNSQDALGWGVLGVMVQKKEHVQALCF